MAVDPIPEDHNTVSPYLVVEDIDKQIEFVKLAFDAEIVERVALPDGSVMHAEVRIGDSIVMMGKASPEFPALKAMLHLYVPNVDTVFNSAIEAGARILQKPKDQFYGNREGGVEGPQGNFWWLGSRIKKLSHEELEQKAAEARS